MRALLAAAALLTVAHSASANDAVSIPDASQLKWQVDMYANKVWLQNLKDFDITFGTTYKYYIDLQAPGGNAGTEGGKAAYAALLAAAFSGSSITIFVTDKMTTTTSVVNFIGR
ncbi:hypothetical protein [Steroidobacter cummioxidans]|uniref:hypothetical protein n=1 Tax=Steroidobacter cummioxidans TaxID=1803913 RepID=UPI000E31C3AD|nr:hypothetical protein [Steroidobacter cummioxidans]